MSEYRNFVLIVRNITQCLETDDVKQGFNSVPQRNLNNSLNQHNQRRIQSSECVKAGSSSPYTNICNEERSWRGANLTTQQAAEKNHSYKHKVKHSWTASVWVKKKVLCIKDFTVSIPSVAAESLMLHWLTTWFKRFFSHSVLSSFFQGFISLCMSNIWAGPRLLNWLKEFENTGILETSCRGQWEHLQSVYSSLPAHFYYKWPQFTAGLRLNLKFVYSDQTVCLW